MLTAERQSCLDHLFLLHFIVSTYFFICYLHPESIIIMEEHFDCTASVSSSNNSSQDEISLLSRNDGTDEKENDDALPSFPKKVVVGKRKPKTSWVWKHFKEILGKKKHCYCLLCSSEVYYGDSRSTGMLEHHIQRKHSKTH